MNRLEVLPCLDSEEMAASRKRELDIDRGIARHLGMTAVEAIRSGRYQTPSGHEVDWKDALEASLRQKKSIPPDIELLHNRSRTFEQTTVQVTNETTLGASKRLTDNLMRPLALNFANGVHPGGGFLSGARAQEENLCRSSALFHTLVDDPMYEFHKRRPEPDSTAWSILSPDVPVFRSDEGAELDQYWALSVITCAAPVASRIGQPRSGDLLQARIHRVLEIARAHDYESLVLGAWGCGAFGNDPYRTARDFRNALAIEFAGALSHVVFAITDWSPERRYLGPFCEVLNGGQ